MDRESQEQRKTTSNQAIEILRKNGLEVSEKEAEDILDIMYFLAKLLVKQNLNS